jgi:hypothetical protein
MKTNDSMTKTLSRAGWQWRYINPTFRYKPLHPNGFRDPDDTCGLYATMLVTTLQYLLLLTTILMMPITLVAMCSPDNFSGISLLFDALGSGMLFLLPGLFVGTILWLTIGVIAIICIVFSPLYLLDKYNPGNINQRFGAGIDKTVGVFSKYCKRVVFVD